MVVGVEDRASVAGVAPAREAEVLADGLADYLAPRLNGELAEPKPKRLR